MKRMTLKNNFHGTETTVIVSDDCSDPKEYWIDLQAQVEKERYKAQLVSSAPLSQQPAYHQYRRIQKALCGLTDCQCGIVR